MLWKNHGNHLDGPETLDPISRIGVNPSWRPEFLHHQPVPTLKLTAKAPENGWLEDDLLAFLLGFGLFFRGKLLVSGSVSCDVDIS